MKITDNQKFFIDNSMKLAEEIYKRADKELVKLLQAMKVDRETILKEIANIMLRYEVTDSTLNMDKKAIQLEFSKISARVSEITKREYEDEKKNLFKTLITAGTDKYLVNSYLLSMGLDFNLKVVDNEKLKKIINTKIEGKNYSERIYDNKCNDIASRLRKDIYDYMNGKVSVNNILDKIKKDFNINANNTNRLFQNELARVQEEVNKVWQDEHGIDYVMCIETLDSHTCEECAELDGKVFKVDDPNRPDYPIHVGCRGTAVSLFDKDYKPSTRYDNEDKTNINFESYLEWKNENKL